MYIWSLSKVDCHICTECLCTQGFIFCPNKVRLYARFLDSTHVQSNDSKARCCQSKLMEGCDGLHENKLD